VEALRGLLDAMAGNSNMVLTKNNHSMPATAGWELNEQTIKSNYYLVQLSFVVESKKIKE